MGKIELVEVQQKYAPDIWEFRKEINGGIYEKTIDVDGCKMKRYWITV